MAKTAQDKPKAPRPEIDWPAIRLDYRAGIKPLRVIGEEHGITHAAIAKRAKRDEWTRDLTARIAAKTEEKVSKAAVTNAVTVETILAEEAVVDANATLQADVILESRKDIQRHVTLLEKQSAELETDTELALPVRIDCGKKMTDTLKTLIGLKRQAYGIAENAEGDKPPAPTDTDALTRETVKRFAFLLTQQATQNGV